MELTLADLPEVRGRLSFKQPLAPYTWFRVGGIADALYLPVDKEDLQTFLRNLDADIPVSVLGACSNVIIRDGGVEGVVIRLIGGYWGELSSDGDREIVARSGALDTRIATFSAKQGIEGLEFLSGIPGTIGAAVHTNAGCYGREFSDVVTEILAINRLGELVTFAPNTRSTNNCTVQLKYRASDFPNDMIVVEVKLRGNGVNHPLSIEKSIKTLKERREASQPIREKTGGSTFANPEAGRSAWQLIEQAGCRGMRVGGAKVSEKHCNFLTNIGAATASDIEELGVQVQQKVLEQTGVLLRWEVRRIGRDSAELHIERQNSGTLD